MADVSVKVLLDNLVSGKATLEQTADAFRKRQWPPLTAPSDAAGWGAEEPPHTGPDSFAPVAADTRLTTPQYQTLRRAYQQATGGTR